MTLLAFFVFVVSFSLTEVHQTIKCSEPPAPRSESNLSSRSLFEESGQLQQEEDQAGIKDQHWKATIEQTEQKMELSLNNF